MKTVDACIDCTNNSTEPIIHVPPPWTLYVTVCAIPIIPTTPLPAKAYYPLERNSTATEGNFIGLVGAILIVSYNDTPVGPYDEFAIIPSYFENVRGSRFYVSQKYTNYNGRKIPKHLAKFDWTTGVDGSTSLKIYPFDTQGSPNENGPSTLPFFQLKYTPLTPAPLPIPINLDPPLPVGNGSYGELPGTTHWAETPLGATSNYPTPVMFDLDQGTGDDTGNDYNAAGNEVYPNFWPELPRWNIGVEMERATVEFPVPETWS
ncbi:uncharacterized protein BDZ99DRAFT_488751 [Mytilinidion resinicola]|uniref:Uncharacterized protein n=1 Tax=Mytilinidion resinicola TaxID=574789 RepID=A0A6A6YLQ4_9PEZI|nr:uncharacterized protein BDZ99DRAFT_488751 [Mytilinidion resinicola]KAF2808914.1 hypothetical protein BDZ99DRAFT_488751 [Mytilinidion resinicola]